MERVTGRWKIRTLMGAVAVVALALGAASLARRADVFRREAAKFADREEGARFMARRDREASDHLLLKADSPYYVNARDDSLRLAAEYASLSQEWERTAARLAARRIDCERVASCPWLSPRELGEIREPSR